MREEKDTAHKLETINKKDLKDYEEAMKVLRELEGNYRHLVDQRIFFNSNKEKYIEDELVKDEIDMVEVQKQKVIKKLAESKVTHI